LQLKKIDSFISRRREIAVIYNRAFRDLGYIRIPYEPKNKKSAYHLYVIRIDFKRLGKSRSKVMAELNENGIGTQVHYIPVHLQPYYRKKIGCKTKDYPEAEGYYSEALSLPIYPKMTDGDAEKVINAVKGSL
jgi:dTDP-4-amino-4,6-dideoxygalactose transaminase